MTRTIRDAHTRRSALAALRSHRAERLLHNGFAGQRARVLAVVRSRLRARGVRLDPADLEECYAQAWQGLYERTLAGEQIEDPAAWLAVASFRRAIDEARSRARQSARVDAAATVTAGAAERDLARELDDRARLRELFEALRLRLSKREREAASLCYLQGLSRSQAAAQMGISEARMRKLMEGRGDGDPGVTAKVGELVATVGAGEWCAQQSSLLRAYAFGVLDPDGERHALAVAHTRDCPACRARVALLRGLASVLPPLPLALAPHGGAHARVLALARRHAPCGEAQTSGRASGLGGRLSGLGGRFSGLGGRFSGLSGALPVKLAVVGGVALCGAGGAYLVARAPTSSARPSASSAAASTARASNLRGYPLLLSEHPPLRTLLAQGPFGSPLSSAGPRVLAPPRRGPSQPDRRDSSSQAAHVRRQAEASRAGAATPPASASEFSPERVRGEAPSSPPASVSLPASVSPPASGRGTGENGEFGIESGR